MGRARAPRRDRIDGLEVRLIDAPVSNPASLGHALRLLARLMVRSYEAHGDHEAIADHKQSGSALTVVSNPRPDHGTNEAA